jgi:hypothetical protein
MLYGWLPLVAAGSRRRGAILPMTWKRPGQSWFPRLSKVLAVSTSCPSSSPLLRGSWWKRTGQQICPSSSQAGPATHGQAHKQRKRLVGWSLGAGLRSMAAAIGAWRSALECWGSVACAPTCRPAATLVSASPDRQRAWGQRLAGAGGAGATGGAAGGPPAAAGPAAAAVHRGADRRPRGRAGLQRRGCLLGRSGPGARVAAGGGGRGAGRASGDGAAAAGPLWDPPGAAHPCRASGGR